MINLEQAHELGQKITPEMTLLSFNSGETPRDEYLNTLIERAKTVLDTYEYGLKPVNDQEYFTSATALVGLLDQYIAVAPDDLTEDEVELVGELSSRLSMASRGQASRRIYEHRTSTNQYITLLGSMCKTAQKLVAFIDEQEAA